MLGFHLVVRHLYLPLALERRANQITGACMQQTRKNERPSLKLRNQRSHSFFVEEDRKENGSVVTGEVPSHDLRSE